MDPKGLRVAVTAVVSALIGVVLGAAVVYGYIRATAAAPPADEAAAAEVGGAPPAVVRIAEARQQELQERFEVIGRLEEIRRSTVAAEVQGKVLAVPFEEGDRVEAGQTVLARIDPVWAQTQLAAAEANVAAAQAELDQSERDLAYLEQLAAAGSAKPKEVDDAGATVKADRAELDAAVAEREEARMRVERLAVVAPFDGVVVDKMVEVGQWVSPGSPIAELISTNQIDARVWVPENLVNQVALGEKVELVVEPLSETVVGEVTAIVPSGTTAARTFPVKVRMDDGGGRLKPGMSVVAYLPIGEAGPKLTVPRDAVLFQNGQATVWAALPSSPPEGAAAEGAAPSEPAAVQQAQAGPPAPSLQAIPMNVRVLFGEGDRYAVEPLPGMGGAMLAPQMSVVIEGGEGLFPTRPLIVANPPQAAGPQASAAD